MSTVAQVPDACPPVIPSMAMSAQKTVKTPPLASRPPMSLLTATDDDTPLPPALYAL